ncbi:MAG: LysR substrate-binding domain-containing protein [Acetobacteraceae bacterium]|nr:LysR family transcriptional regulator [Pseudomonadota bacterium]
MAPTPNLRGMDLNLLTIFEVVFETGSITRGADRLGLTQPTTSHALGRLREAFKDDLFTRSGHGVAPTPTARQIYPQIKKALDELRRAIAEARGFDPGASTRQFTVAIPHPMGPVWALAIRAAVQVLAPQVRLTFDTRTLPIDIGNRMRDGDVDVCVDWFPVEGDRFVLRKLFDDRLVFIARGGHPRVTPDIDLDALRQEQFAGIHPRQGNPPESMRLVRREIERLDLTWAIHLSEFLEVPFVALLTDLVCYLPESMLKQNKGDVQLHVLRHLLSDIPIPISLVWHESRRADEGHRWIRDLVASVIIAAVEA